jgi:hypothetical protein
MEKLFPRPNAIWLVVVSLISFTVSTVASLAGQTIVLQKGTGWAVKRQGKGLAALISVWFTFAVGLISLLVFTLMNLLSRY